MVKKINIKQLIALRYLLEEKHVSRAAVRACVSQPAMSKVLQSLRDDTGDPLLIRDGNDMLISPYAKSILKKLVPALELLENVLERSVFEPKKSCEIFTIASSDYFCSYVFPDIFSSLNQEAENTRYQILNWGVRNYRDLEAGNIDVAAAAFLDKPDTSDKIEFEQFGQDHLICIMGEEHPLAGKQITADDYLKYPQICVSGGKDKSSVVEQYLNDFGHSKLVKVSVPYYFSAFKMLQNSHCLLTAPLHIAKKMSQDFNVKFCEVPHNSPKINYFLLWPKLKKLDEAHSWLRTRLLEIMTHDFQRTKTSSIILPPQLASA